MFHYFEAITNTSGDSLIGYFARVVDPATQNTVTISADDNGTPIVTTSGVENAAVTDAYGNLDFYVVPGTYHLDIYAPNATSLILRVQNVSMNATKGDPGEKGDPGDPGNGLSDTFTQTGTGAAPRTGVQKLRESVSVVDFYQSGDADDSLSFSRAFATGKMVYAPAGNGHGPSGVYLVDNVLLPSRTNLYGDGASTVIRQSAVKRRSCFNANSGSATAFIDDVTISDLTLEGYVVSDSFFEQSHLLCLNGARRVTVERCRFLGFQGDGIYVGSGDVGGDERHNFQVVIRNNFFDGINSDNRNGISVIDCTGIEISGNRFVRTSRFNMPGPIDFEPDPATFHRVSDVTVSDNQFDACGGNLGIIGFLVPPPTPLPSRIVIRGNKFTNYVGTGADIAIDCRRVVADTSYSMEVLIDGNAGSNGRRAFDLYGCKGVTITDTNTWQDYIERALIGFNGSTDVAKEVFCGATLRRCGTTTSQGLLVGAAQDVTISGRIEECGQNTTSAYPIQFISSTSSSRVSIKGLRVKKRPNQIIAINNDAHTFSAATNRFVDNDLDGMTSQFQSVSTNPAAVTYSNGWSDAGSTSAFRSGSGFATVALNISGGTLASGTLVAMTPVGYRPSIQISTIFASGTGYATLRFDPDGSVFLTPNPAAAAALRGSITYPTGV